MVFRGVFCIKRNFNKISNFWPKSWTIPSGKMRILWVFQSDVFMAQKGFYLILYNRLKIVFSRFIVTIYYMEIQGLQGVTGDYKGWQGVTRNYRRLQGVTAGYKGLQKNCFLTRTSPDTFSWSMLHKHKSLRNLNFRWKRWTNPFGKIQILRFSSTDVPIVFKGFISI